MADCEHEYEYQKYFAGDDTCIHCGETETWVELQKVRKELAAMREQWNDPVACHNRYFELVALNKEGE